MRLSSGPWGQFLPYSEVFMGCHSLGRLPFCHQFLKRQQHFSSFTVNNCEDFCGLTYPIAQKKFWMESSSNLSLLLRWVMTWHGGSIPRSAERCRAAPSPIQNKTMITGPGKAMKFCWSCQFEMSKLLYKNLLGHLEVPCCYVAFAVFLLFSIFHLCGFFWLKHSSVMILRRGPPCQQEWHVPCKPQLIGQILSAAITCCQNGSSPISFSSETI